MFLHCHDSRSVLQGVISDLEADIRKLRSQQVEHPDTKDAAPALNIYAAAKTLAECMDYPWESMPETGRQNMMDHAQKIVDAAIKEQGE